MLLLLVHWLLACCCCGGAAAAAVLHPAALVRRLLLLDGVVEAALHVSSSRKLRLFMKMVAKGRAFSKPCVSRPGLGGGPSASALLDGPSFASTAQSVGLLVHSLPMVKTSFA